MTRCVMIIKTVRLVLAAAAAMGLAHGASAGGLPCRYDVTAVIDSPFADDIVRGEAINNHNEVCGSFTVGMGNDRAFYWTPQGGFVAIPTPAGVFESVAHDISDAGLVVGVMRFTGSAIGNKGFIHDIRTGQTTLLSSENTPGQCEITGVNEAGVVCGFRSVDDGGDVFVPTTAFRWSPQAGFEDMTPRGNSEATDINESNQCSGWVVSNGVQCGLRWNQDGYEVMPSLTGGWTESRAINDDAVMTGFSRIPWPGAGFFGAPRCVRWTEGAIEIMGDNGTLPGFDEGRGFGCNSAGIVAGAANIDGENYAFVVQGGILRSLNDFNTDPMNNFWISAPDVNDNGILLLYAYYGLDIVCVQYAPQTVLVGDANGSCDVNVDDLLLVINQWGMENAAADLDDNGVVNVADLIIVVDNWGSERR